MTTTLRWPPNFRQGEFDREGRSPIAPQHMGNVLTMAWTLQTLRNTLFDRRAVLVTSGYRAPADYERLVRAGFKPAKNSYHNTGQAVDFVVVGLTPREVQRRLQAHGWPGGLGTASTFTHIDLGPKRTFGYS